MVFVFHAQHMFELIAVGKEVVVYSPRACFNSPGCILMAYFFVEFNYAG